MIAESILIRTRWLFTVFLIPMSPRAPIFASQIFFKLASRLIPLYTNMWSVDLVVPSAVWPTKSHSTCHFLYIVGCYLIHWCRFLSLKQIHIIDPCVVGVLFVRIRYARVKPTISFERRSQLRRFFELGTARRVWKSAAVRKKKLRSVPVITRKLFTESFSLVGCRMSVEIHLLHSHIDHLSEHLDKVSGGTSWTLSQRYQNNTKGNGMLVDCCYCLKWDSTGELCGPCNHSKVKVLKHWNIY